MFLPQIQIPGWNFNKEIDKPQIALRTKYFTPIPDSPQLAAYHSKADILGFGGGGGGGKTLLGIGAGTTAHRRTAIFRRVTPNLKGIIADARELLRNYPEWIITEKPGRIRNIETGQIIELESCQYEDSKLKQRGRARDLLVFDEATEFSKTIIQFIIGWLRTTIAGQRTRAILTFNPPLDSAGSWITEYFLPWLAYLHPKVFHHPNPCKPGKLRYFATVADEEMEFTSSEIIFKGGKKWAVVDGEAVPVLSRTFIPALHTDNPYLDDNYLSVLNALPEPLRSQLKDGNFAAASSDNAFQVIPTAYVLAAMERGRQYDWDAHEDDPVDCMGIDPARGGKDFMAITNRRKKAFYPTKKVPGVQVPNADAAISWMSIEAQDSLKSPLDVFKMVIDVIGIGSSVFDDAEKAFAESDVVPFNASEGSDYLDKSGKLKMRNQRARLYWEFRDDLHPTDGLDLILPPDDRELLADLCSARYKVTSSGVMIESKDDIKKRIGRSPDKGESTMLANISDTAVNMGFMQGTARVPMK